MCVLMEMPAVGHGATLFRVRPSALQVFEQNPEPSCPQLFCCINYCCLSLLVPCW